MKPKTHLTEAEIAAIAEGGVVLTAEQTAAVAAEAEAAAAAEALAATQAAEALAATQAAEAAAAAAAEALAATQAAEAAAAEAAAAAAASNVPELVTFLQAQVKEKDAALVEAAVSRRALDEKLAGIEATHTAFVEIARNSIKRMAVALGGAGTEVAAMSDVALLAEHTRIAGEFSKKFKVGGVASVAVSTDDKNPATAAPTGLHAARVAATKR